MSAATQNDRVLKMLRRAGRRGITQLDADALPKPIRRLASRVNDLRRAGYLIETRGRRQKMAVYVLAGQPAQQPPAPTHAGRTGRTGRRALRGRAASPAQPARPVGRRPMSWARLDDLFDDNRKVKRTFRRCPTAIAVYVMAITYCARHATDGVVDIDWLEERLPLDESRADVLAALTAGGLFEHLAAGDTRTVDVEARTKHAGAHSVQLGPLPDDVYLVHDFLDYNPSSVEVEARRAADAQRKRQTREERPRGRRADSARTPRAVNAESESPGPTRPDPTRPDPRSSSPDVGDRAPARAAAPGRTTPPPKKIETPDLAEHIRGILQRGIDGLTSDAPSKTPTVEAIRETLAKHNPPRDVAEAVAVDVRSIAQSQDRAPNIAALFAKKLAERCNGHHTRPTP